MRSAPQGRTRLFRHGAAFYRGLADYTRTVGPFVVEGLAAGEPVLVVDLPDRIEALCGALGSRADEVRFLDMATLGRNPARIIPAWRRFVEEHPGRSVRGVGEPVWAGRRAAELEECRLHESLLNVAFDEVGTEFRLLCPYDASTLPGEVLADAARTHPVVGSTDDNPAYAGHAGALMEFERPLPEPPADAELIGFGTDDLAGLRSVVHRLCEMTSLAGDAVEDLVLATHELASNSVRHGGGEGVLRGWREPGALVLEVSDRGVIRDPLVGREEAAGLAEGGRGVWMANQLCDLVQVRSSEHGTSVRLHSRLAG